MIEYITLTLAILTTLIYSSNQRLYRRVKSLRNENSELISKLMKIPPDPSRSIYSPGKTFKTERMNLYRVDYGSCTSNGDNIEGYIVARNPADIMQVYDRITKIEVLENNVKILNKS